MSDRAAGWYPDPEGQNRQRFWDGDSWADYYAPLISPQPEVHGAATAETDYPYLTQSRSGSHEGLMATPGEGIAQQQGAWPSTWPASAEQSATADGTQEFTSGRRRSNAPAVVLVIASVLVVVALAGLAWWLVGGG